MPAVIRRLRRRLSRGRDEAGFTLVAVLTLAVLGVAYTNISRQPLIGYWEFLALATRILCGATEWENAKDSKLASS